jgi:tRNA modification GTPase
MAAQMQSRGESGGVPRVVLCGLPNAGKSSLLNALAGEDAALVSNVAGTTRDFVSRRVRFEQVEMELVDTAGLENSSQAEIGREAQRMAREQAENCTLRIRCLDGTKDILAGKEDLPGTEQIVVLTKCDLPGAEARLPAAALRTSSHTGEGIAELRRRIVAALANQAGDAVASTAARCRESLALAADSLRRARGALEAGLGDELIAAEVRAALDDLGRVVGAVYTEDILDRIFSRFCIGK